MRNMSKVIESLLSGVSYIGAGMASILSINNEQDYTDSFITNDSEALKHDFIKLCEDGSVYTSDDSIKD